MSKLISSILIIFACSIQAHVALADAADCGSRWTQQQDGSLMNSGEYVSCWYVDAGAGYSNITPEGEGNGWSVDRDEAVAWHVRGGWHFRPRFFAELNYVNLGAAELVNSNPLVDLAFPDAAIAYQATSLMAGFNILNPDGLWNIHAKLGVAYVLGEEQDDGNTVFFEESGDVQVAGGLGVSYRFANTAWRARFDADAYAKDIFYLGFSVSRYFGGRSSSFRPVLPTSQPTREVYQPEPTVMPQPSEPIEFRRQETQPVPVEEDGARVLTCSAGFTGAVPSVNFAQGSANLRPQDTDILNTFANDLIVAAGALVEVQAHTDTEEAVIFDQGLAQRRAETVRDLLVQFGVPAERLTARGFGASYPIGDNASDEGREMNRRVVFDVLDRALCN